MTPQSTLRAATLLALTACVSAGAFGGAASSPPQRLDSLRHIHPRLLLDRGRVDELKSRLASSHRSLWQRYQHDLPHVVAVATRSAPLEAARYDGDLVPELAFAWLMTGRSELLDVAKAQMLRLASDEAWSTNEDLAYLVPGHYILGIALGHDWLHDVLTPAERGIVAQRLGREAEAQHRRITRERVWWRNQYFWDLAPRRVSVENGQPARPR